MKTPFAQSGTHPVAAVRWEDAAKFCQWLTERERKAGRLAATEHHRLPRDHEWSCAVGLGAREDAVQRPDEKSLKIDGFPWGGAWPPPSATGNFAGEERRAEVEAKKPGYDGLIAGYNDGFHGAAPVGSFPANALGLFDLAGNVAEHCEDWNAAAQDRRTIRGGGADNWGARPCVPRGATASSRRSAGFTPASASCSRRLRRRWVPRLPTGLCSAWSGRASGGVKIIERNSCQYGMTAILSAL